MSEKLHVLIVEDNQADIDLIREALPETGPVSFQIESVSRLSDALARLKNEGVDLVLLDLGLPDSQGLETFHKLRKATSHIPVIILTGNDDQEVAVAAVKGGAQDYLVKGQIGSGLLMRAVRYTMERKRLEDSLTESEERYRRLFETASDGIVLLEKREGKITHANPATEKMLGYTPKESIGNSLQDIGISLDMGDFRTAIQDLNKRGIIYYDDVPAITKSGQQINTDIYLVDRARLVQCNVRDISQRKQAEENLRKRNEEIRDMTQQLWQAAKLATMGELASSIAHELNNPLATVSLRIESLCEKTPEDNSNHRELKIIEHEVERMGNLVANLLQFSRRGQQQISTVDVCEQIEKTLELIYYHLHRHNIIIGREFAKDVPHINADYQQLMQLFLNLFTNASDAMPSGGTLTIRVFVPPESKQLVIEVTDTGIGIPPEVLPKVMEPFFTTKQEGRGTGLGLAICRRIVQGHKGTFDLTSEGILGRGTTARISLPVTSGNNAAGLKDKDQ